MDNLDYAEIKNLTKKYQKKFSSSFTALETDLIIELHNKLNNLDDISKEIVNQLSQLMLINDHSPDENDMITYGPIKIQLKRADPNIPIKLDNTTVGYLRGGENILPADQIQEMEKKLERTAVEFYQIAHRITHITGKLPRLTSFQCKAIRTIRNHLIEHPEGKESGITYDSFAYSKNEGPFIKGTREGQQTQFMDAGFKKNSEEFIWKLKKALEEALI